jgi:hypothetical protein
VVGVYCKIQKKKERRVVLKATIQQRKMTERTEINWAVNNIDMVLEGKNGRDLRLRSYRDKHCMLDSDNEDVRYGEENRLILEDYYGGF